MRPNYEGVILDEAFPLLQINANSTEKELTIGRTQMCRILSNICNL